MPAEQWNDVGRIVTSGLLVAVVAMPVALLVRVVRPRERLLLGWKPWRVPWNGFEVVAAFVIVVMLLPSLLVSFLTESGFYRAVYGNTLPAPNAPDTEPGAVEEARTIRMLWAGVLGLPLQLGMLWIVLRARYPDWPPAVLGRGSVAGKVVLAVAAWLLLAPAVLCFNAIVNAIAEQQGVTPESHSLARLAGRPLLDQVLFVFEACVGAPVREEVLVRGVLLAWCVGRLRLPGAGVAPPTAVRPWIVMGVAALLAAESGKSGAMAFAGALAVGLMILWWVKRTGARRCRAVYATAALFGLMHSSVWPNPIPLFVLGLGLGWLAVRTNGVLVPILVHSLFNAISVLFVLRGGSG